MTTEPPVYAHVGTRRVLIGHPVVGLRWAQVVGVVVGTAEEALACEFIRTFDGARLDEAMIERVLACMSVDASYQVYGWDDPVVGHEALRAEFRKQSPLFSDTQTDIQSVASVGRTVFVQRTDNVTMFGKRGGIDVVGVFELDDSGKVTTWRDYLDSRQIAVTFGLDFAKERSPSK